MVADEELRSTHILGLARIWWHLCSQCQRERRRPFRARAAHSQKRERSHLDSVQQQPKELSRIDFWSMPICTEPYAQNLNSQITRGTLVSQYKEDDLYLHGSLKYIDELLDEKRASWLSHRHSYRGSINNAVLRSLNRSEPIRNSTALIALDSCGLHAQPLTWAEALSAFRSKYCRLIGHLHIPDRGFHHWKTRLSQSNEQRFSEFFIPAASQCDAVILTSQSLLENDVYLPARQSTDMLVAELMVRLLRALGCDDVLERVAPLQGERPRTFALGSAGAHRNCAELELRDLLRQREIVFHSFGKPTSRPALIGLDLDRESEAKLQEQLLGSNMLLLNARTSPESSVPGREWLEFVALWPFDPAYGPWP